MTQPIVQIENISAHYGNVRALQAVSLDIAQGEIFGLLGPNGAGKTTLLSCMEGLHTPGQGSVHITGLDVRQHSAKTKSKLGIQLQRTALLDDLMLTELIEVYAALYEVYLSAAQIVTLLKRFDLHEQRSKLARHLSGGQQQRLSLALAIANDPKIVLLDEPTSALDPHARRNVWDIIRTLHDEGRTIILTTHAMEEAEALCGRIAIIDGGRIVACDTPAQLVANLKASSVLKVTVELPLEQVRVLPAVNHARYTGAHLEIETAEPQVTLSALQELAIQSGRAIRDVMLRQPNLEDVFLQLTGKPLNV
jgi:ABC-2 type transport system ATP-binding protein